MKVVDELGLVLENEHLVVYIPATAKALVFRVKSRVNKGFEKLHYGPVPLPKDTPLPSYLGGVIPVPADGVMPATAYIPSGFGISFPTALDVFEKTDMWYIPVEWRERLFHVIAEFTPRFLRVDVEIPKGVTQRRFQKDKVTVGVDKTFGFTRGKIEVVHFPGIHYGYRFGNDTNLNVWTSVDFTYAEYIIEIPKDAEMIFNILTRKVPSYWLTMPIAILDETIRRALIDTYGTDGFPLYPINKKNEAVAEYSRILKEVKV
jgi:hypothetical protein